MNIRLDFNYVYENNLTSGEVMGQVVGGTVRECPGRYGGGIHLLRNAAVELGQSNRMINRTACPSVVSIRLESAY